MGARTWTIEDHLQGLPRETIEMYERFVALIARCGPFDYVVGKTAITFRGSQRLFAGAKPQKSSLNGFLDLPRLVQDPRILRAAATTKRLFVHQFRVTTTAQWTDDSLVGLLKPTR